MLLEDFESPLLVQLLGEDRCSQSGRPLGVASDRKHRLEGSYLLCWDGGRDLVAVSVLRWGTA